MKLRPAVLSALSLASLAACVTVCLFLAGGGAARQPVASLASRVDTFVRPGKLDVGDVVRVTLFGLLSPGGHDAFDLHVAEDGTLVLPMVGPVPVKGLTSDRAAAAISAAQARLNLQNDAIVIVGIVRAAGDSRVKPGVIAMGENLRITLFDITGPNDRLEVLAQAAEDGTITMPMVGAIKVVGLTEAMANDAVKKAYEQKSIIDGAAVSVLRLDGAGLP